MASHASIGGHPIHPMIIPFPIALWFFSLIADLIYLWGGNPLWRDYIAFYTLLGGIIGGAAAAVPGLIDWLSLKDREVVKIANLARASQCDRALDFRSELLPTHNEWRRTCDRQLHHSCRTIGAGSHLNRYLRLARR